MPIVAGKTNLNCHPDENPMSRLHVDLVEIPA
jgi:hypothetical protein